MKKNLATSLAKYFTRSDVQTTKHNLSDHPVPTAHSSHRTGVRRGCVRAVWKSKDDDVAGARKQAGDTSARIDNSALTARDLGTLCQGMQEAKRWLKTTRYHKGETRNERLNEQVLEAALQLHAMFQEVSPEDETSLLVSHWNQDESSNVIPDSSNICTNDNQVDQNVAECVDERAALANLIANLTLDTEENKTILKQLKKANASLTQELKECKTNLDETSRALGEATSSRDSCLIALQTKQKGA
ncbi:hypothetical protein Tco_0214932 [Tanacetum coccineum]